MDQEELREILLLKELQTICENTIDTIRWRIDLSLGRAHEIREHIHDPERQRLANMAIEALAGWYDE